MISVVIPTYNRLEATLTLLDDVLLQRNADFEIIVVDDHSAEDHADIIRKKLSRCSVLRNSKNSGPAVTRNRGIRAARGDIIVGFDNDVSVPDRDALGKVAEIFAAHQDVDGLAFHLFKPDGISEDVARWWHPVPIQSSAHRRFLTSYFSGTAYAFRREAMVAAGLFPEILFMHYEELELALRVIDRGGKIMYCPELSVLHHAHPVSRRSEIKMFYQPRNQVLLAVACLPFTKALGFVIPRLIFHFLRAMKNGHLASFIRAMCSAAEKIPACWKERQVLKRSTFRKLHALRSGVSPSV